MVVKVGIQGTNGAFSEIAAMKYFHDTDIEIIGYKRFSGIFEDVENGTLEYGMLPVENTTTGIIARTYDLFRQYDIHAIGEINIPIVHNLITLPDAVFEDIREVYSHPEALSQCQKFFEDNPSLMEIPYPDTAKAAEYIKELGDKSKAAIGSWRAAEYFSLITLKQNIQDVKSNVTRFLCISREAEDNPEADKISMSIILRHAPGALYNVLGVLAKRGINMVKLESRPIQGENFNYLFYIDFVGNMKNRDVKEAVRELQLRCAEAKILGCYKADPTGAR